MIEKLVTILQGTTHPPTGEEIADALWLARYLPRGTAPTRAGPDRPPPVDGTAPDRPAPADTPERPPAPPRTEPAVQASLPTTDASAPAAPRIPARLPSAQALPSALRITRALRPLRFLTASPHRTELDEAATATASAEQRIWVPRLRPVPGRSLELAVVWDTSRSMTVWRRSVEEFVALLEHQGGFRDVRTWLLDADAPPASPPGLTPVTGGSRRSPRELVDPGGRRVILVVSDCLGAAWRDRTMAGLLRVWGGHNAVAVVQPLPQRLWVRCGQPFTPARFQRRGVGMANTGLDAVPRDPAASAAGLAVPVLEMEPRWLGGWARMLADSARPRVPGVALYTGQMRRGPATATEPPAYLSAEERVRRFRAAASPTAFRLACYLSAVPLSLPVMRWVQRAMLPHSRPAHLAEVFLGGLLRPTEDTVVPYDFHDGVAELLLTALWRDEVYQLEQQMSQLLDERLGSPRDFGGGVLSGKPEPGAAAGSGRPFAKVRERRLNALGGDYAAAVRQLRTMSSRQPAALEVAAEDHTDYTTRPHHSGATVTLETPNPVPDPSGGEPTEPRRSRQGPAVWGRIPLRNPNFTGREANLIALRQQLNSGSAAVLVPHALHGMGGVGKTQLALEYAHRFRDDYDLVWWIPAEQLEGVRSSYVELAERLGLSTEGDPGEVVARVREQLRTGEPHRRWLIVFDNADDPGDLEEYLPYPTGHILITSRNPRWSGVAQRMEVDVFQRSESVRLLRNRAAHLTEADAERLAEWLGDLPLALAQAAAWQVETGMPVDEHLELLREHATELLEQQVAGYPASVVATWKVAFDRLRELNPAAAQLLQLCAFFSAEPITYRLLQRGGRDIGEPVALRETLSDSMRFSRAIRAINAYALATINQGDKSLSIHRLVQSIIRDWLDDEEQAAYRRLAQLVMTRADPGNPDEVSNWDEYAEIDRHVHGTELVYSDDDGVRETVLNLIRYRYLRDKHQESRALGELTVKIWRQRYGWDDEKTLRACQILAIALRSVTQNDRARELNEDTLERMRRVLGEDNEHTLTLANSYGADLRASGRFDEALRLDQDNLRKHEQLFGLEAPETLRVANNLAVDYRLRGDFAQARDRNRKTLLMREHVLGPSHQRTLASATQLARDLRGTGEYHEALDLLERIIPRYEEQLGPEHTDVIDAKLGYAVTLRRLGRIDEARELAESCLLISRRRLEPGHINILAAQWVLADTLRLDGDLEASAQLSADSANTARRRFGPDHILTVIYQNNYSILVTDVGDHQKSLELNLDTAQRIEARHGKNHPYYVCIEANLASDYYHLGDDETALGLSGQNLRRSAEVRGEEHPLTQLCYHNHSLDLRRAGRVAQAEEMHGRAVAAFTRQFGHDHPEARQAVEGRRLQFDIEPPII